MSFISRLFISKEKRTPRGIIILNYLLMAFILSLVLYRGFKSLDYSLRWDVVIKYRAVFISGFLMTLKISSISLVISFFLGLFFGIGSRSWFIPLKALSRLYVEIIRGTPLLVQILIFFYVIANAVGVNDRYVAGVVIMSLFSGAYISEIIRAGIESIGASQRESARAIGLNRVQTYRFILLPQVITRILPPLAGQFASLIKDSSLLSIIAIKEFTMAAREINANTFSTIESYIPLAIGYLILTIPVSLVTRHLEKRFRYET